MASSWELRDKNFPNEHFTRENIYVFWNVEDYPLPPRGEEDVVVNGRRTINNIISAFRQLGSVGRIGVIAFTKNPEEEGRLLINCGAMIWHSPDVGKLRNKMERYVVSFPRNEAGRRNEEIEYGKIEEKSILVVVANVEGEFCRVLTSLKERGQQIVFLKPEDGYFQFADMRTVLKCGKMFDDTCLNSLDRYDDEKYGQQDFNDGDHPLLRLHPFPCYLQDRVWFKDGFGYSDSDSD